MKVAIPVDDQSMETKICVSFGRTPYFLIYDTETKKVILYLIMLQPAQEEQELRQDRSL